MASDRVRPQKSVTNMSKSLLLPATLIGVASPVLEGTLPPVREKEKWMCSFSAVVCMSMSVLMLHYLSHDLAVRFTLIFQVALGDYPVQATCPQGHVVTTRVRHEPGDQTWLCALFLCILLGPLCALIPFCMDDTQDAVHECPIDGTVIGVYKKGC